MKRSGVVGFVAGSEVGDLSVSFASAVMGSWADSCSEELETFLFGLRCVRWRERVVGSEKLPLFVPSDTLGMESTFVETE